MKKAFTMIELIFVIVILGIISAIAVPKLAASRDDAKIVQIQSNLKTIIKDLENYYAVNGSFSGGARLRGYFDISKITNVPVVPDDINVQFKVNNKLCVGFRANDDWYAWAVFSFSTIDELCKKALLGSKDLQNLLTGENENRTSTIDAVQKASNNTNSGVVYKYFD